MNPRLQRRQASFQKAYSPTAYIERYDSVYWVIRILSVILMVCLAVFSFKFWQALAAVKAGLDPIIADVAAGVITSVVILVVAVLMDTIFKANHAGDKVHWLLVVLLVVFVGGDVYCNIFGIEELVHASAPPPVDHATPETDTRFQTQLDQATAQKQSTTAKLQALNKAKGSGVYVKGGASHWKGHLTKYGKREKLRLESQLSSINDGIASLNASWTDQSALDKEMFQTMLTSHTSKVETRIRQLKYLQVVFYAILIGLIWWKHDYGKQSAELLRIPRSDYGDDEPGPSDPEPEPAPQGGNRKRVSRELIARAKDNARKVLNFTGARRAHPLHSSSATEAGQGFRIFCDYCGEEAWQARKPVEGEGTYCCKDHRLKHYTMKRRERNRQIQAEA